MKNFFKNKMAPIAFWTGVAVISYHYGYILGLGISFIVFALAQVVL